MTPFASTLAVSRVFLMAPFASAATIILFLWRSVPTAGRPRICRDFPVRKRYVHRRPAARLSLLPRGGGGWPRGVLP
eukprot:6837638-Pyramimonas_sp.AAC.1